MCTLWSVARACRTPYGPGWCGTMAGSKCFRGCCLCNADGAQRYSDVRSDLPRKVPLNVGSSPDKVEKCRNVHLRGLLAVCAILSAFISQIYGQNLAKELLHLLLVWERQVDIHAGENEAASFPQSCYQSDLALQLTASTFPSSLPSRSERSIDPPRVSFSTSSGLWPFSNSPRPVWPDRGRFQTGPDSDETPPLKLQLKHTVARVLTESMCVCVFTGKYESNDQQRPI